MIMFNTNNHCKGRKMSVQTFLKNLRKLGNLSSSSKSSHSVKLRKYMFLILIDMGYPNYN